MKIQPNFFIDFIFSKRLSIRISFLSTSKPFGGFSFKQSRVGSCIDIDQNILFLKQIFHLFYPKL